MKRIGRKAWWLLLIPALCLGLVFAFVLPPTAAEAAAEDYTLVGDVNGDGKVSNADVTLLTRYVAGWTGYDARISNMDAADVDRDGQVNDTDVTLLSRAVKGWTDPIDYWATYIKEVLRVETGELRIVKQPVDHWRDEGDTAAVTFTVEAAGGKRPYSYQWYYTGRTGATAISGATKASYTYTSSTAWTVWCVITDADDTQVTSRSATVDRGLYVSTQPVGGTLTDAAPSLTLTTAAAGGKGRYSYQWYKGGNLIGRATSASYTATAAGSYYCIITSSDQTAQTDTVQVKDGRSAPLTISIEKTNYSTSTLNYYLLLSVTGGKEPYRYQWYNDAGAISGSTYMGYTVTEWGSYYCVVTDSAGNKGTSDTMHIYYPYRINLDPRDSEVGKTLFVGAEGGKAPYSYQWYKEGSGAIRDAISDSYVTKEDGNYYCVVTDGTGTSKTSRTAAVTYPTLRITTNPSGGAVGKTLSVVVTGGKEPYRYQWYNDAGAISRADSDTYVPKAAGDYWCVVTDGKGTSVTSDKASLRVEPLQITKQPSPELQYIKESGNTTLDIETTGGLPPVTCQWEKWTGSLWRNFRTGTSVRVEGTQAGDFRCVVTDASGTKLISKTVTVAEDVLRVENVHFVFRVPRYITFDVKGGSYTTSVVKIFWTKSRGAGWKDITNLLVRKTEFAKGIEYTFSTGENTDESFSTTCSTNCVVILVKDQDGGYARYFFNCLESDVPEKYKTW